MSTLAMSCASVKRTHDGPIPEPQAGMSDMSLWDSPQQTKKCRMMAPPKEYVAVSPDTDRLPRKRVVHRRPLPPAMCDKTQSSDDDDDDAESNASDNENGGLHNMDDDDDEPKRTRVKHRHFNCHGRQSSIHQTSFVPRSDAEPAERFILSEVKRKKRLQVKEELSSLPTSSDAPAPSPRVKFTVKQVKSIVEKAVRARETELREEFADILARKLEEQYHQFTKYTQDFVHQRLQQSQFNYMS
ncbi:hypothetical protein PTSG_05530 [Salpingoeca rosetta]|uniref:Akirin n=1 Tax=Salpingoeca rosetta (strain ATCC 50818 / BSB-021) TaxID=946362 RepID=F2UBH0_SALR5|nr:uncharacterized protein PTSG_05530 [Salpingoeca rosetta]EGD73836.1 hypothetical protein PTSG_05530 [Salpingoeca rosetta]|eukprot:XP_004993399.1 hypothetical protein PTSG_05530 [Salpingoeca rosetta]